MKRLIIVALILTVTVLGINASKHLAYCSATVGSGLPCLNQAVPGSTFCTAHTPSVPQQPGYCAAYTASGAQCLNPRSSGSQYCFTHNRN